WVSSPLALRRQGCVSAVAGASPARQWQVRLGRSSVWFGNFEREGATPWLLNQSGESIVGPGRTGERALVQVRAVGTSPITTGFERRIVCRSDSSEHTVHGWVRTQNSRDAGIRVKSFSDRYVAVPMDSAPTPELDGTNGWTRVHATFTPPGGTKFFDLELRSEAPQAGGTGRAWFDDAGIVEWGEWQQLIGPVPVTEPNDWCWVQLRTAESTGTAVLTYDETGYDLPVGAGERGHTPARTGLRVLGSPGRAPAVEFAPPRSAGARLRIFDSSGRLVRAYSVRREASGVTWDGRDDAGRSVSTGLYFCRLETAVGSASVKLVLAR
ncbi:MAG: FlgD immunoglobulin-like domain containing protein, partial [bacterium]